MTEQTDSSPNIPDAATPVIRAGRSFSIVWLVPLVALAIGSWLAYKAITEKGPVVTISFENADGIEAGKTRIKFKDVEVGVVESIDIKKDLSGVDLTVEMKKDTKPFLTENTKFWIVRARIAADEISGLGTLLGGVYIGIEPSKEGKQVNTFIGLEKPPIVTTEMQGKHFYLTSQRLGSLESGSPIYFRQIKVGRVVDYELDKQTGNVKIHIFIFNPYDQFVREHTVFWFASGLDLQLSADGLRIDTESMVSLLIGGVSFSSLSKDVIKPEAAEFKKFTLYRTFEEARDAQYTIDEYYYIEFTNSVRGLSVGAPVEFRGMRIGSVEEIELKADFDKLEFNPMVKVTLEKQRLALEAVQDENFDYRLSQMINKGLRAQLKTGNLLAGQLFIDLEYFPEAPQADTKTYNDLNVFPSVPSASQQITQDFASITSKLNKLPLEQIGHNLQSSLAGINRLVNDPRLQSTPVALERILKETEKTLKVINSSTVPEIDKALLELENLLKEMEAWFSADAPLYDELDRALKNVSRAAKAINDMADMLERQPESLIQGKSFKGPK